MYRKKSIQEFCLILTSLLGLWILLFRNIARPGYIMVRDILPLLGKDQHISFFFPLWNNAGSYANVESIRFLATPSYLLPIGLLSLGLIDPSTAEKLELTLPVLLAFLCMYFGSKLLLDKPDSYLASWLAAISYVLNPLSLNLLFDTPLYVGYAYAPLVLALLLRFVKARETNAKLLVLTTFLWFFGVIKFHVFFFMAAIVYGICIALMVRALLNPREQPNAFAILKRTCIVSIAYLAVSSFWILPSVVLVSTGSATPSIVSGTDDFGWLNNQTMVNTARLLGVFWPVLDFQRISLAWTAASFVIPTVALLSLLLSRRKLVLSLAVMWMLAVFLVKGVGGPLGFVYAELYQISTLLPNFIAVLYRELMRVSTKFNFFLGLSVFLLLAFSLQSLYLGARRRLCEGHTPGYCRKYVLGISLIALVGLPIFITVSPAFSGDLNGFLAPVAVPSAIDSANKFVADRCSSYCRVLWLPPRGGKYIWAPFPGYDIYVYSSSEATYSEQLVRMLYSYVILGNRTQNLGKLLSPLGIQYVLLHIDLEGDINELTRVLAILEKQADLRLVRTFDYIYIFENEVKTHLVTAATSDWIVTGGLETVAALSSFGAFDPAVNALFLNDLYGPGTSILTEATGLIVRPGRPAWMTLLRSDEVIYLSKLSSHSDFTSFWASMGYSGLIGSFGLDAPDFDFGAGFVATQAVGAQLSFPIRLNSSSEYVVFSRHVAFKDGGVFSLRVANLASFDVSTYSESSSLEWHEIGRFRAIPGITTVTVDNLAGENAINLIAILSSEEVENLQSEYSSIASHKSQVIVLAGLGDFQSEESSLDTYSIHAPSGANFLYFNQASSLSSTIEINRMDDYSIAILSKGHISMKIGQSQIQSDTDSQKWGSFDVKLFPGTYRLRISASSESELGAVIIASKDGLFSSRPAPKTHVELLSVGATRYVVELESDEPVFLLLALPYDLGWRAVDQTSTHPWYVGLLAVRIEKTGQFILVIEYQPQRYLEWGIALTLSAVLSLIMIVSVHRPKAGWIRRHMWVMDI